MLLPADPGVREQLLDIEQPAGRTVDRVLRLARCATSALVMQTSEKSIGSNPAELSIVSETSARPRRARLGVPAKMTSSILEERNVRGPCAPSTQATASTMLDLPDPFGPTTTVTPGSNSRVEVSAKDLKPFSVSDFRNTFRQT